ncbi:NADH-quinone oxidoreductase subunit NuoF [Candidatus Portiera aleyrodidarum]|uniref:NADH-quinone oxidoreductase subunit NuoF n=1 Tax=Candidatus Portiera aleyrodidarum TaxID=91844 RepID=UPI000C779B69|nr:NADH-quinone oxidoreductase subunit NuoF [Candidatus Portiera aleyrodidarum]AUI73170.1 NADH oxidoreductase (quinone) subunit F [Candidatus Portiera aleyrodidarum]
MIVNKRIKSVCTANIVKKSKETHPLTWRLNKEGKTIWLNEYVQKEGYIAVKRILKKSTPEEVKTEIKDSGLKGRGGAGFITGIKWSLTNEESLLLCNADEMEPNTYKDRLLLEQEPHLLIEGMIIAAYANNSYKGYIFIRGEYIDAINIINIAIKEARKKKFLGKNILNSEFCFDICVHSGAGRYICGEETALINSLEGYRANPKRKPPFPGQLGAWGKPTVINNVETLCNIPSIINYGLNWYKKLCLPGSEDNGTKLMGCSGKVKNPGLWEVPMGITAMEIIEEFAGGMIKGYKLKAWQPGGASTGILLPKHLKVQMCSNGIRKLGTRIGTAIILAIDDTVNIIYFLKNIEKFFNRESCGWCTPCREGLPWIVKILKTLENKKGKYKDLDILIDLTKQLTNGKTFCALAPGASEPLISAIKYFRNDFDKLMV